MSNYDFDNLSEGEWEDRGETAWNEFDWQQYLQQNDRDIDKFCSFYEKVKDETNPINEAAFLMGWNHEDWSHLDLEFEDFNCNSTGEINGELHEDEDSDYDDLEPYTLHRHPAFIVTRALYRDLKKHWENFMKHCPPNLTPIITWQYSNSIHRGELNAILSLQAIDMGDYALAICHLKTALSDLNQSISILQTLSNRNSRVITPLKKRSVKNLFGIREVWLQMMKECREGLRRRYQDEE